LVCLWAAVESARPGPSTRNPSASSEEATLASLLERLPGELVVVLDNYHLLTAREVHAAVEELLAGLPPNLHLAILSRADSPVPLSRLGSSGRLAEIRESHLRFTNPDAGQFFRHLMGLDLAEASLSTLNQRTKGWIPALQLAAASLAHLEPQDWPGFIASFAGSNRYILDYLVEEVFSSLPEVERLFLLQTSILERLSGPPVKRRNRPSRRAADPGAAGAGYRLPDPPRP
jgi:LuxR family transcriptional regulator, maltose regulon positive regulatory protein